MDGQKWFKFYGQDWLTSLKVRKLSPNHRLCFVTLLCLASASKDNTIRCCEEHDILELSGFKFGENNGYEEAKGCLQQFEDMGMITRRVITNMHDTYDINITSFDKRQSSNLSGYERIKRYREKNSLKTAKTSQNDNNDNVVITNVITTEESRGEERRKEKRGISPLPPSCNSKPKTGIGYGNNPLTEISSEHVTRESADLTAKERGKPDAASENVTRQPELTNAEGFERFWEIYPKKAGRESARQSWRSMKLDDISGKISVFVEMAMETDRWKRGFIPSAKKFLEERRWEEDLDSYADAKPNSESKKKLGLIC